MTKIKKLKSINGIFMIPVELICLNNNNTDKYNVMKRYISDYYTKELCLYNAILQVVKYRDTSVLLDFTNDENYLRIYIDLFRIESLFSEYKTRYPDEDITKIILSLPSYCNYENLKEYAIYEVENKINDLLELKSKYAKSSLKDLMIQYSKIKGGKIKNDYSRSDNIVYTQLNSSLEIGIYGFPNRVVNSFNDFIYYYESCYTRWQDKNTKYYCLGFATKPLSLELEEEVKQFFISFPEGYIAFK